MGIFRELEDGTEILLEIDDIPPAPAAIFADNPYLKEDPMFIRWRVTAIARYAKAQYKAVANAKNEEHFLAMVGDAKALLQDPSAWESYLSCRGLDEPKRPVGRPKLTEEKKVQRSPKIKRRDEMQVLLEENGFTIEDGFVYDNRGSRWKFLINGKVETEHGNRMSAHQLIEDHIPV